MNGQKRRVAALTCALLGLALCGCGSSAKVRLQQPFAPPAQQDIRLESDWSFTDAGAGRRSVLVEFPLPGSEVGPRDFHLYLSLPETTGDVTIDPRNAGMGRGFLIQEVGRYKGKTEFESGFVMLKRGLLPPRGWRLELDINCRDGARLTGSARLQENTLEVGAFRRKFVGDLAALEETTRPPQSAPTPGGEPDSQPTEDESAAPADDQPAAPAPTASRPVEAP